MFKVGIVGLGNIAKKHISVINNIPIATLAGTYDIDISKSIRGVKQYNSFEDMISSQKFDCIHLCLPHYLHFEYAKMCFERNQNFILEKPACINQSNFEELRFLETKSSSKGTICFQNRYSPSFIKLQHILEMNKEKITNMRGILTWRRDSYYYTEEKWRGVKKLSGGGVLINQAIHLLDWMCILGGKITNFSSQGSNLNDFDIDVEDTIAMKLQFSKTEAFLFATVANSLNESVSLDIYTKTNHYLLSNYALYKIKNDEIKLLQSDKNIQNHYYGSGHQFLVENFYDCIINDKKKYIRFNDTTNIHNAIFALYQ